MEEIYKKIREIEEEIKNTEYNKRTQHHIGKLKAKLAKLKKEAIRREAASKSARKIGIKKSGDSTVAIIGPPNVGKSTLFNKLTSANSPVSDYEFTTTDIIPGMLKYKGAEIQILDLPGIIEGAAIGRGRGREVLSMLRSADLALIVIDNVRNDVSIIVDELYDMNIRLNQKKKDVSIKRNDRGGICIRHPQNVNINHDEFVRVLEDEKYINVEVTIRESMSVDEFRDAVKGVCVYIPGIVCLNKIDAMSAEEIDEIIKRNCMYEILPISCNSDINIDILLEKIYEKLNLIRIYLKPKNGKPDFNHPLVLRDGAKVSDVCKELHKDFINKFRYAIIFGSSVKFNGQKVGLEHKLNDGDVLTIIVKR